MTQKQLKEQVRIECHKYYKKKYNDIINRLTEENKKFANDYHESCKEIASLKRLNLKLADENEKLKYWVERLQEFMDMSDNDRNEAFKVMKEKAENTHNLNTLFKMFGSISSLYI